MIDTDGFRPNVGIVLMNTAGQVFWARRVGGQNAWQFPQGGINENESAEQALYRELFEEVGLRREDVKVIAKTRGWLRYRLPKKYLRHGSKPLCIGCLFSNYENGFSNDILSGTYNNAKAIT